MPEHIMLKKIFNYYKKVPLTRTIKLKGWSGVDYIQHYLLAGELPQPRLSYCIASYGRYGFDADGNVYACGTAAGQSKYAIGSFVPNLKLDNNKAGKWRRRKFTDIPQCLACKAAPLCGGGCTLQSLLKHSGTRPFCPDVIKNIEAALDFYFDEIENEK